MAKHNHPKYQPKNKPVSLPGKKPALPSPPTGPAPGISCTPSLAEGIVVSAIMLLMVFLLYGKTLNFGYVLDDRIVITDNMYTTRGLAGIPDLLSKETFEGYFKKKMILVEGGRYRPLSLVTFAVEWELFEKEKRDAEGNVMKDANGSIVREGNPRVSHLVNLILYALTGILLFYLLFRMFPAGDKKRWLWNMPFIASLLFILHPVHTEAVANIKGRDEIMAMMGALLALLYSLKYVQSSAGKGKIIHLVLAAVFYFLGLLSKENTVTFLFIIPLTIYFFTNATLKKNFIAVSPIILVTFIYAIIRINAVGMTGGGKEITELINNPFYGMSFADRYATILYTLWIYIKLLFFPHPLTIDYYPYHIPWLNWADYRAFLPLLLYLGLAVVAWRGFRKKSIPSYSILYFILTLSVASNIFFSIGSFMNERFVYMSSLAFCILVAWLAVDRFPVWLGRLNIRQVNPIGILAVMLFSAGFIYKTLDRVPDWKNELTLDAAAVKVSPGSARANCFMGVALFDHRYKPWLDSLDARKKKDPEFRNTAADTLKLMNTADSMLVFVNRALKIYPRYASALVTKSGVAAELYKLGRYDEDWLLSVYDTLVRTGAELPFIAEFTRYLNTKLRNRVLIGGDEAFRQKSLRNFNRLKTFYLSAFDFYYNTLNDRRRSLEYIQLATALDPADHEIIERLNLLNKRSQVPLISTQIKH